MSYSPQFCASGAIPKAYWTRYRFESHGWKLVVFTFQGHFDELYQMVLGFYGDLEGMLGLRKVWESWLKTCRFLVLVPFKWVIGYNFALLGRFPRPIRSDIGLRVMAGNLSFSRFRAILMSYSPQFWGFIVIPKAYLTRYRFGESWLKTYRFLVLRPFSWAIGLFWGSRAILKENWTHTGLRVMAESLLFSRFRAIFMSYNPQFLGSRAIYKAC